MQINKYRATIFFLLFLLLLLLLLLSSTLGLFKLLLSSQYTYLFVQQILYSLLIVSPCFLCVLVVSARPLEIWSDRSFNAVEYFCYSIPIFPFNTSLVCSIFVCVCVCESMYRVVGFCARIIIVCILNAQNERQTRNNVSMHILEYPFLFSRLLFSFYSENIEAKKKMSFGAKMSNIMHPQCVLPKYILFLCVLKMLNVSVGFVYYSISV